MKTINKNNKRFIFPKIKAVINQNVQDYQSFI